MLIRLQMPIHPTAIIEDNVEIGPDCEIGAYAVVKRYTRLGARNRIYEHAVIGGEPQDVKFRGERSYLEIGYDNIIREFCTLHRANGEDEITRIGSRNFLMVGVHVAHNCVIGDDNIFREASTGLPERSRSQRSVTLPGNVIFRVRGSAVSL